MVCYPFLSEPLYSKCQISSDQKCIPKMHDIRAWFPMSSPQQMCALNGSFSDRNLSLEGKLIFSYIVDNYIKRYMNDVALSERIRLLPMCLFPLWPAPGKAKPGRPFPPEMRKAASAPVPFTRIRFPQSQAAN